MPYAEKIIFITVPIPSFQESVSLRESVNKKAKNAIGIETIVEGITDFKKCLIEYDSSSSIFI
ncbi:hypothetical protein [Virgibacillus dokdonensis]|uniref:hypothetical protein n=1 Tax=Virgibacillus dokdonensis TaxID=302167 RepID=UPI00098AE65E|nr:hypothetical protein [Virgibacillus dokdonensis]